MASSTTTPSPSSEEKYSFPITSLSAVNVSILVSSKLWGNKQSNNYSSWKQQMLCLIESHDLLCFINDSPKSAAVTGDDKYFAFRKTDMLLKGWILGTLSDGVLNTVANCVTAKDVWLELEKKFTVSAGQPSNMTADTLAQKDLNELYKAILKGNWEAAKEILKKDPHASKARINSSQQTALHVAVATCKTQAFLGNLVGLMIDDELIAVKDDDGNTALSIAAAVGNKEARTILVGRMPKLLYISNNIGDFPIQQAALFANRDMLRDLISLTKDNLEINPYADIGGLRLLIYTINAEFFDVALYLVEKYPHLAKLKLPDGTSALKKMATLSLLRNCKSPKSNLSKRSDFSGTPVKTTLQPQSTMPNIGDIERMAHDDNQGDDKICGIQGGRLMIQQAIRLIECLCEIVASMSHEEAAGIYVDAIVTATELGSRVVVKKIVEAFPDATYCSTPSSKQSILHIAAKNRSPDVFNHIYRKINLKGSGHKCFPLDKIDSKGNKKGSGHKYFHLDKRDSEGNNLLHAAAKLAPSHKLNEFPGAALQMQCEIKWYKDMERIVHPNCRDQTNQCGKTPKMVFDEEHEALKEEAEQWMKGTANSCMVAAALIASVAFAGVIQVPGGLSDKGKPNFSDNPAFIIYMNSNICSLWMATISLLLLLFMSLSRYADEDFQLRLPGEFQISLAALFSSVAFMIISSYAALTVIFKPQKGLSPEVFGLTLSIFCAPVALLLLLWKLGPLRSYFHFNTGYGVIKIR